MDAALLDEPGVSTMGTVERALPAANSGRSVQRKCTLDAEMPYKDAPGRTRIPMPETTSRRSSGQRGARSKPLPPRAPPRKRLRPPRLLTYADAVARHGA